MLIFAKQSHDWNLTICLLRINDFIMKKKIKNCSDIFHFFFSEHQEEAENAPRQEKVKTDSLKQEKKIKRK